MSRRLRIGMGATMMLLPLAGAPAFATNGNIGLFFDPGATTCQQFLPCGQTTVIYVFALFEGASQFGINGAEYKVQVGADSLPDPGWSFVESFDPAAVMIGSGAFVPVDGTAVRRGVDVLWPTCQVGDGTKILIETVLVLNSLQCDTNVELALKVVAHDTPSFQVLRCPLFMLCDAPTYSQVCLGSNVVECPNPGPLGINAYCSTSGEAFLNGTRDCTVATQAVTWSVVKGLYRR